MFCTSISHWENMIAGLINKPAYYFYLMFLRGGSRMSSLRELDRGGADIISRGSAGVPGFSLTRNAI